MDRDKEFTSLTFPFAASLRQRALVGLEIYLGMHQIELHESQIELAEDLVKYILKKQNRLLRPYLNQRWLLPRPLEERLEQLQEQYDIPLQTTLAKIPRGMELLEHRDWIDMGRSSTQHLWQAGVLNEKTILSHCVHCSDDDFDLIKKRESSVVHCSTSNLAMSRGICDVRKLLDKDIKVGLGTDVASGSSMSMLDVIRQCVQLSKVVKLSRPGHYRSITTKEAFTLATLGGATVLGLKRLIGNFEVGKEFDAILVDPDVEGGPFDLFLDTDSAEDVVERFLNLGDDRNIREVYVSGRKVHPT